MGESCRLTGEQVAANFRGLKLAKVQLDCQLNLLIMDSEPMLKLCDIPHVQQRVSGI